MVLSSAIVCDHDRRIVDDRRPYCDLRFAIIWKPAFIQAKLVLSQTARCYLLIRAILQEINGEKRPEKTKDYSIVSSSTVFEINVIL